MLTMSLLTGAFLYAENNINHHENILNTPQLMLNLAPGIAKNLNPPAIGSERKVNNVLVHEENGLRTYIIEGKDIYYTGRVLNTFRLRLQQSINHRDSISYTLDSESQKIVEALLNTIYQISELGLNYNDVILEQLINNTDEANHDLVKYDIIGLNNICEHVELNSFKLSLVREVNERGYINWYADLEKPYLPE